MEYLLSSVCFLNVMVFYTRITEKKRKKELGERYRRVFTRCFIQKREQVGEYRAKLSC